MIGHFFLIFFFSSNCRNKFNLIVFQAEIGRHMIGDREWEVYRVLLDEGDGLSVPRNKIAEGVWKMLMGWQ